MGRSFSATARYQVRKIAFGLGSSGNAFKEMIKFIYSLYNAYDKIDASMFEINPVLKTSDDQILAVDAKVNIDDNALYRQKNITEFQDPRSKVRFFVGNPQTGGYGITLTQANTVIYYSNGYDLEKRLQSEDRAHRIGQKKSVTYVDLIAEKTVDEKIVKALRKKIDIVSQIMGEKLEEWI